MRLITRGELCGGRMSKPVWPKPIEPLRISVGKNLVKILNNIYMKYEMRVELNFRVKDAI
jgi:hypothetical protein